MTYCDHRPWLVLIPNKISSALIVPGLTCPWNLGSIASAGSPGISRGSRKLRVSAAQSVNRKKPRRRSANLKLVSSSSWSVSYPLSGLGACPGARAGPRTRIGSARRQVQQHLLHVRERVRRWLGVGVARGGPAAVMRGAVLVPVHRLHDRDDGQVGQHDLLQLADDVVLLGRAGGAGVGLDQRVGLRVLIALIVRGRRLADRRGVAREQPV